MKRNSQMKMDSDAIGFVYIVQVGNMVKVHCPSRCVSDTLSFTRIALLPIVWRERCTPS